MIPIHPAREKIIKDKIDAEEAVEMRDTEAIRHAAHRFLADTKGYLPDEIIAGKPFDFETGGKKCSASADFLISLKGRSFMTVICASGSIDSWERHALAISRLMDAHQVPFSLVTDGIEARLLDTLTGKTLSKELSAVPSREEALKILEKIEFKPYPPERLDKEKRILLAFEGARCPKGADTSALKEPIRGMCPSPDKKGGCNPKGGL